MGILTGPDTENPLLRLGMRNSELLYTVRGGTDA